MMAVQIKPVPWNAWWQKCLAGVPVMGWVVDVVARSSLNAYEADLQRQREEPNREIEQLLIARIQSVEVKIQYDRIVLARDYLLAVACCVLSFVFVVFWPLGVGVFSISFSVFFIVALFRKDLLSLDRRLRHELNNELMWHREHQQRTAEFQARIAELQARAEVSQAQIAALQAEAEEEHRREAELQAQFALLAQVQAIHRQVAERLDQLERDRAEN